MEMCFNTDHNSNFEQGYRNNYCDYVVFISTNGIPDRNIQSNLYNNVFV